MLLHTGLPVVVSAVAMIMDLRTGRVDNGWILFSAGIGLLVQVMEQGALAGLDYVLGMVVPFVLLAGLFCFHMLGAGDIKVFCVLGGQLGVTAIIPCIFVTMLLGSCISMALLISTGDIRQRFHYFISYFADLITTGERKPYIRKGMAYPENYHFTVPVFLSVLLYAGGIY